MLVKSNRPEAEKQDSWESVLVYGEHSKEKVFRTESAASQFKLLKSGDKFRKMEILLIAKLIKFFYCKSQNERAIQSKAFGSSLC